MTGFELVAGVIAAFFCCGILLGVLIVIAVGQSGRDRSERRRIDRYGKDQAGPIGWIGSSQSGPSGPIGPDWEDRPGWEEPPGPDDDDTKPRWPGGTSA